jgi:hypothetical protein
MGKAWASLKRPVDTHDAVETIPASVDSLDTVERICPLRGSPDGLIAGATASKCAKPTIRHRPSMPAVKNLMLTVRIDVSMAAGTTFRRRVDRNSVRLANWRLRFFQYMWQKVRVFSVIVSLAVAVSAT